jgi:orotidine-5'-phosphate decarboxylase
LIIANPVGKGKSAVTFLAKLRAAIAARSSLLCVGLDPEITRLPHHLPPTAEGVLRFNQDLIAATSELACAYKPNVAFYEALGPDGFRVLRATRELIPRDIPVIGDAKRGDVGNTARAYASALFDLVGVDAVTVNPYLGSDALEPFFAYGDRGVYVVCRTSNPGAADVQSLLVSDNGNSRPLYEAIALRARGWNARGNAGLVVGATAPADLQRIRALTPELPILIPGVGAQGGDLAAAVAVHREAAPTIVSASRSIIYASSGPDFAEAARTAALKLRDTMRAFTEN